MWYLNGGSVVLFFKQTWAPFFLTHWLLSFCLVWYFTKINKRRDLGFQFPACNAIYNNNNPTKILTRHFCAEQEKKSLILTSNLIGIAWRKNHSTSKGNPKREELWWTSTTCGLSVIINFICGETRKKESVISARV